MIFNRFFRSKHLDPNPYVRIKAIEKLNKELLAEKTVLHELAFNDPDAAVSLAALHKLDSFTLWYKMSETGKDERVLKKSQQVVEKMLFEEGHAALKEKDRLSFIRQCNDVRLLEKLVYLPWVQADASLSLSLLTKLAKPQVVEKVLLETTNIELQSGLLDSFKDEANIRKLLAKLIKKSHSEQIKEKATALLHHWDKQQQRPVSVEKDTKMLLSRLLALKESTDLTFIQQQHQALSEQYIDLSGQFDCLTESKKTEFEQKWHELNQRLQKAIDGLLPLWQEKQASEQLNKAVDDLQHESKGVLDTANAFLSARMEELTNAEVEQQGEVLNQLYDRTKNLLASVPHAQVAHRKKLESIIEQIIQCHESLANLPAFVLCLSQSGEVLKQFTALSLPDDISQLDAAEQYLQEVKQQWRAATHRFSKNLPLNMVEQWQNATASWQRVIKKLNDQVNQDVARCRTKYRTIEGLIEQGRFRLAIELYRKVVGWFGNLPEKQQAKLQKLHSQIKLQIENLQDWQEYIATPRKPALLADAEYLVANPLEVEQQAKAVKVLRQQWSSLGVIDSESDHALNQAFDETIEKAFVPCRLHYEQQQIGRTQNLLEKNAILAELEQLNQSTEDPGQIAKRLTTLQQKWRNVGEVEFSLRNALYEQFQQAVKPIKAKVSAFYKNNAQLKELLLIKAKKCLELNSADDATQQIKNLQIEWKSIAHAGKRAEAELWPAFRQVCDSVFAKRSEQIEQYKRAQEQQIESVKQQLAALQLNVEQATSKAEFEQANALKTAIFAQLSNLPSKERSGFERQLNGIDKQQHIGIAKLESLQTQRHYALIFAVLKEWQQSELLPKSLADLPNSWQQAFTGQTPTWAQSRHELTVMLEIISQQASPKSDGKLRQALQMQLMAQKLQDGVQCEPDELLQGWISKGPLLAKEQDLLQRVQSLFAE